MNDKSIGQKICPDIILRSIRLDAYSTIVDWNSEQKPDWPNIQKLAMHHGIFPLIYPLIKSINKKRISSQELKHFETLNKQNSIRNLRLAQKLLKVLDILAKKNILAVPLRGPLLAIRAFGDLSKRSFSDLDILIRSEDIKPVYNLMKSAGYVSVYPRIKIMEKNWKKSGRDFLFQNKFAVFEFHQRVIQGPRYFELDMDDRQQLSVESVLDREIPVLNVEETIIGLALHGQHHGWDILKWVVDFSHFVHKNRNKIEWEALILKSRDMGCFRILSIGFLLGHDICRLKIPEQIAERVEKDKRSQKLAAKYKELLLKENSVKRHLPVWAVPQALDSIGYKFRYLGYYLFNPTVLDIMKIKLPDYLYPLYYVIRPIRLFLNSFKKVFARNRA